MDSNECDIIRPCFRSGALHVSVAFVTNDKVSLMAIVGNSSTESWRPSYRFAIGEPAFRGVRARIERRGMTPPDMSTNSCKSRCVSRGDRALGFSRVWPVACPEGQG